MSHNLAKPLGLRYYSSHSHSSVANVLKLSFAECRLVYKAYIDIAPHRRLPFHPSALSQLTAIHSFEYLSFHQPNEDHSRCCECNKQSQASDKHNHFGGSGSGIQWEGPARPHGPTPSAHLPHFEDQ
jgi:hypothetical protein